MSKRYEKFYKTDWENTYSFWYKINDKNKGQIKVIRDIIQKINKRKVRILDLACGEGREIKKALSFFPDKDFKITANDTSKEVLEKYIENNKKYIEKIDDKKLETLPQRLKTKFDLILFSHCLYETDLNKLFRKYLKLLNKNGVILVFIESDKNEIMQIRKKFWKIINGDDFDENSGEDIIKELKKNKIKFGILEMPHTIDLQKLERINKNGVKKLFIPFLFRKRDIEGKILQQAEKDIKKLAKNKQISGKILGIVIKKPR